MRDGLPTGTVTFVFTDIEGSTRLWQEAPAAMATALARHDEIRRVVVDANSGFVFSTGGDGFAAVFSRVADAAVAAVDLQRRFTAEPWPDDAILGVRVGLHTGEAVERDGDYFGPAVNKAARVMATAHGGQVLCSTTTHDVLEAHPPAGIRFEDLGRVRFKGFSHADRVFGLLADGLASEFPALRDHVGMIGDHPPPPDRIIGRTQEIQQIAEFLATHRLVTLTGTGGVGKTTLALAAIAEVSDKFEDGVWWVDLAAVGTNEDIVPVVANVLRVRDHAGDGLAAALTSAVGDQVLLLVLDNCEHVLAGVQALVARFVNKCPEASVFCTSRTRLGLSAERDLAIRPLGFEGERSSAVELLVERIGRPELLESAEDRAALEDIATRLDGLPLALELAAARCRTMSPAAVATRLRERIRLPAARGEAGGLAARATLDGTVQWSYDLLTSAEQRALARLAVFSGSFSLDAAEQVICALGDVDAFDADDAIGALVEHSLVEHDGARYRMLETTREFARGRLIAANEQAVVEAAHLAWVLSFLRVARQGLRGPEELRWVDAVDADWGNVRAAFQIAMALDDPDKSSELTLLLFMEGAFRRPEASSWLLAAYERDGEVPHRHQHELIGAAGWLCWERGSPDVALELGRRAVALDPNPGTAIDLAPQWSLVAGLAFTGDPAAAIEVVDSMIPQLDDDPFLLVWWLYLRSLAQAMRGTNSEGIEAAARADRVARRLSNPSALALSGWALAYPVMPSDPERAETLLLAAAEHARSVRATFVEQMIRIGVVGLYRRIGKPAAETLPAALELAREFARNGLMVFGWPALLSIAASLLDLGHHDDAARCHFVLHNAAVHMANGPLRVAVEEQLHRALVPADLDRLEREALDLDFNAVLRLAESHL